ncbi:AraC family transcriptional regulator [Chitinophaga sp.]|uniref:AraC family transcriptional regulator n=1 Tax=Chitinophaga sp. TaxID=1869181 RepID=UPI002F9475EF
METTITFKMKPPSAGLSDFVESFWMLENEAAQQKEIVVLPDGRFDIIFSYAEEEPFHAILRGLDTEPGQHAIPAKQVMFAISFKLLAIEYLLDIKAAGVLNNASILPDNFWNVTKEDLGDFDALCSKVSASMLMLVKPDIDSRKQQLFDLIYTSSGALSVKELSEKVFWSSRQINRYFNQQFGISLKAYCNILRFRASLQHIKEGQLFPEQDFADQTHFIKEIKKFSGVVPKELSKNANGRFILLSALPE